MTLDNILEIGGLLVGLLYLYWEFRAHRLMWVASLVMTCISLYVYWHAGLYADFGINVYYLLAAIYGFAVWSRRSGKSSSAASALLPITRTPLAWVPRLTAAFAVIYAAIAWLLIHCTNSTVPYIDSLNTSLSIVAMYMQAQKWVEQWLVWLVVNAVSVGLYILKDIEPYAILYTVYAVLSVVGYRHWLRKMAAQAGSQAGG